MRKWILAVCLAQPFGLSTLQAAQNPGITLTPIRGAPTGGCHVALDVGARQIVGHDWNDGWRFQINGRLHDFRQRDSAYDSLTGAYTARTRDRAVTVRTVSVRSVSTARADYDIVNIEVSANGATRLFRGYRFCPPGD